MKKDKIKLIIISFIVIALSILLLENKKSEVFAQASEENRNGLTVEKVIRVGWWEQPKFQEKDSNGNYTGYCYEYLCKIAEINNWKYKFVEDKFENLYKSLKEGKIDILGCLFYTSEREKELDMSTFDMGEMYSTMFALKTSKLQSEDFNAFNNIKIAVINSNNLVALNKYAEDNGFKADILICSDYKEILKTLDDGRADAGVVGGMADSKYKILAKFAPNKFYFATSKDNSEISLPLNKALSKISIDDPYYKTRLADKYLYGMEVSLLLNKTQTIILLTTIIVIFSLLIIIAYVKIKYNISEKKRINEMYYLMKYIFKINDSVGEINLLKNEIIKYTLNNKSINKEKVEFLPYEIEKSIYLEDIELYKKSVSQEALNEIINNQSQRAFELRKKNKDKYEWHAFVLQGIAKDDEHPCNFMYFDRNIDTIKRADEIQNNALIYASKEIAKASEAKSAFVSKISHEIRTPLNAIFGYLNIAKNDITNLSKMTDNLFKSEIAAKQLLDVINDVTDITSIDNRKLKILKQPFELRQLINTLYIMFEQQAKLKDITFVVTVDERLEKFVLGDCLRVNQILLNLLSNAIKFTNNGGLVSFKTEVFWITKDTTAVRFIVSDNGIGMDDSFLKKICQPFEQESNNALKYGGSGLGLAICKSLLSLMKGVMNISSEKNKGSVFTIEIPFGTYEKVKDINNYETEQNNEIPNLIGKRLLLAEDNEMNREIAVEILKRTGAEIDCALNGKEVAEKFACSIDGYYSMIFMDIQMPEMDGYTATKIIRIMRRSDAKSIPIIAMTANTFNDDVDKAIASGMNSHIAKPIDINTLYMVIDKFVN